MDMLSKLTELGGIFFFCMFVCFPKAIGISMSSEAAQYQPVCTGFGFSLENTTAPHSLLRSQGVFL